MDKNESRTSKINSINITKDENVAKDQLNFEETIAIDKKNTKCFEQTYSYDKGKNCLWIHILCPTNGIYSFFHDSNYRTRTFHDLSNYLKKRRKPFENNAFESCISLQIYDSKQRTYEENLKNTLYRSKVKLTKRYNFDESDEIFFGDEQSIYNDWIKHFVYIGHELREQRTGSSKINFLDKDDSFSISSAIIAELSIFFSSRVGRYMVFSDNFTNLLNTANLVYIRLFSSVYILTDEDKRSLIKDLQDSRNTNAFYSDLILERINTFKTNNVIPCDMFKEEANGTESVEIFSNALELIKKNLNKLSNQSICEIWKIVNDRIFPQFLYFEHRIRKYRPKNSAYHMFYTIKEAKIKNLYNFDGNSLFYAKLTEPLVDTWNLIFLFLIYKSISQEYHQLDKNIYEEISKNINERLTIQNSERQTHENDKKKDNTDYTIESFKNKEYSFYAVIQENRHDPNNDTVISFKFPHIQTYYRQPINYNLNLSKIFKKYSPKNEINSFEFSIKIFLSLNNRIQNKQETIEEMEINLQCIDLEKWTSSLSFSDFKMLYSLSLFSNIDNEDEIDKLNDFNTRLSNTVESGISLKTNGIYKLNVKLNFDVKGLVFAVQVLSLEKFKNKLNKYDNSDYENYKKENPNEASGMNPIDLPDIEVLHLTKDFHYCFVHHSKAKEYDFMWIIKNIQLEKQNEYYKMVIQTNAITKDIWLIKKYKFDKVCLSCLYNSNRVFINNVDRKFVKIIHGTIINFNEMISIYSNENEVEKLVLELKFDEELTFDLDYLTFDVELYEEDVNAQCVPIIEAKNDECSKRNQHNRNNQIHSRNVSHISTGNNMRPSIDSSCWRNPNNK